MSPENVPVCCCQVKGASSSFWYDNWWEDYGEMPICNIIHNKLYLLNLYCVEVNILVSFINHAIPAHYYNNSTMQYIQGLKTST